MGLSRNFSNADKVAQYGQTILHEHGWVNVTVSRTNDESRNVGVTSELEPSLDRFTIRAKIDPLNSPQKEQLWVGLVEPHILPMMKKGDTWLLNKPNATEEYKVRQINGDEIELERL